MKLPGLRVLIEIHLLNRSIDEFEGLQELSICFAHMSSDQNSGWLGYIGEYTTQLYRDFSKPL